MCLPHVFLHFASVSSVCSSLQPPRGNYTWTVCGVQWVCRQHEMTHQSETSMVQTHRPPVPSCLAA